MISTTTSGTKNHHQRRQRQAILNGHRDFKRKTPSNSPLAENLTWASCLEHGINVYKNCMYACMYVSIHII